MTIGVRRSLRIPGRVAIALSIVALLTAVAILVNRPAPDRPSVDIAVVGDSYTAGRFNTAVWPTLLSQRTGMSVANFALPGSGFAADGQGGYAFGYQVDRALQASPATVLIVGGIDDGGFAGTGNIGPGVLNAVDKVIRAGKRVLIVGPTWYDKAVPPTVVDVATEIRQAAQQSDVPFLDALNPPMLNTDLMLADRSGPNDLGQSVLADKIGAWVRDEVRS